MPQVVRFDLNARVSWRAARDPRSELWVGVCDPLRLTAQADTWQELVDRIGEIQQDLFLELLQEKQLERFLADHGWTAIGPVPRAVPEGGLAFDIPVPVNVVPALNAAA